MSITLNLMLLRILSPLRPNILMTKVWVLLLSVLLFRLPQEKNPRTSGCVPIPKSLILGGASGACGHNCIAAGTSLVPGASWDKIKTRLAAMGTTLRVQVAQRITNHPADYRGLWVPDGETTEDMEDRQVAKTWDEWLTCIRRHKRWICALTIKTASARLGVQVIVVQKQGDAWVSPLALVKAEEVRVHGWSV